MTRILCCLLWAVPFCLASDPGLHYLGPEACELCHKDIAAKQERTAMANTWQGRLATWLPASFETSVADDLQYRLKRTNESVAYSVDLGHGRTFTLPVTLSVGGRRHGLGFLIAIQDIEGIPLARPALLQARYAWSPEQGKLLLAPGCPASKPASLEAALGLVLSPTFEKRCLDCHGRPMASGSGNNGGVHCEACHGPGSGHLAGIAKGSPAQGIINPKRLSNEKSIDVCARCHVGLTNYADPSPADLLIANQVRAIRKSECFLQSGKAFSCTTCHDPHSDSQADDNRAVNTCLSCHSGGVTSHAAICPVNRTSGCIDCHMPSIDMGPLHLVDHLIRVHPETKINRELKPLPEMKSRVHPISEYLRLIATNSAETASAARRRLDLGESFYTVARESSLDPSAAIGGYLGRKELTELPEDLRGAAAQLSYGETSPIVRSGRQWVILERLPRDFRWQAEELQSQAESLAEHGDAGGAIKKAQEALMLYPQFLRALSFIGITFTQNGNPKKGAEVLAVATRLYPDDASAEFARAASLNLLGNQAQAIAAYKRVIALEGDFTAAYVNLGMIMYSTQDWQSAIKTFRQGLQIDPLSAELSYDLALALLQSGDVGAGTEAMKLARKLDEGFVAQRQASH